MKGVTAKKLILRVFLKHNQKKLLAKFQLWQPPPSCFLVLDDPYLTNICWKYFSWNLFTVLHQSKLKLSNLDQDWAKTRPLLLKTWKSQISMDSHIVQCVGSDVLNGLPFVFSRNRPFPLVFSINPLYLPFKLTCLEEDGKQRRLQIKSWNCSSFFFCLLW